MPSLEKQFEGFMLIAFLAATGIVGVAVVWLLFIAWRRFNNRNRSRRGDAETEQTPADKPDPWRVAGQRAAPVEEEEDDEEEERK